MRSLRQQMLPKPCAADATPADLEGRCRAALIQQLVAPFQRAASQPKPGSALPLPAAAKVLVGPGKLTQRPPAAPQQAHQQPAPGPCQQGSAPTAKRTKRGGTADDMQYFLQLQRGSNPGAPPAGNDTAGAAAGAGGCSSSSDEAAAEALDLYQQQQGQGQGQGQGQTSTSVHSVELPASHAQLLRLLREDEQRLVRSAPAPGVAPEVARSDFFSLDVLQRALEQAAGECCCMPHCSAAVGQCVFLQPPCVGGQHLRLLMLLCMNGPSCLLCRPALPAQPAEDLCSLGGDPPDWRLAGAPRHPLRPPVPGAEPGGAAGPAGRCHGSQGAAGGIPAGGKRHLRGFTQALCSAAHAGRHRSPGTSECWAGLAAREVSLSQQMRCTSLLMCPVQ